MESDVAAHVADRDGPERVVIVGHSVWVVGWARTHLHFKYVTVFAFDGHDQGESVLTVKCPHERHCGDMVGGPPTYTTAVKYKYGAVGGCVYTQYDRRRCSAERGPPTGRRGCKFGRVLVQAANLNVGCCRDNLCTLFWISPSRYHHFRCHDIAHEDM